MKASLLFIFFLTLTQVGKTQSVHPNSLSMDSDGFDSRRIKPGAAYKQSYSVKAEQTTFLHIQLRNRFSAITFLKSSVPLVAATTFGLLRQRRTLSQEGQQSQTRVAPYLASGVVASGASFALIPKRKRAYLELTYRNMVGTRLRTEGQWINVGKKTSIEIRSQEDGWVDVTILASNKQGLQIHQMNFGDDLNSSSNFNGPEPSFNPTPGGGPLPPYPVVVNATKYPTSAGCTTFRAMWNRQNNDRHVEQAAFITNKGIFWLTDINNQTNFSETGYGYEYNGPIGAKTFTLNGIDYTIEAIVHTHPLGPSSQWQDGVSAQDRDLARGFGVPIYSIADEGIGKGLANGSNAGIIDYNYANVFDCALDQNIIPELN